MIESGLSTTLRVVDIINGTTVDGPGFRTSIYFAGCNHGCPGCHNPSTWPMDAGKDMAIGDLLSVIEDNGLDVTFSGGDPMLQAQPLLLLAKEIKSRGYGLWCYTGFLYETVFGNRTMEPLLEFIDVLVDGPFVSILKDTSLLFRGSSNQRLVDVAKSAPGSIVLWESDF